MITHSRGMVVQNPGPRILDPTGKGGEVLAGHVGHNRCRPELVTTSVRPRGEGVPHGQHPAVQRDAAEIKPLFGVAFG